jgi:hypothetical protein
VAHPTSSDYTRCPNAPLNRADLSGVDLVGADLSGAKLIDADLSRAYLTGAVLRGVDLTGADLVGASLDGVVWDNTKCPDGSNSDLVGGSCVNDLMVLVGAAIGSYLLQSGPLPVANNGPDNNLTGPLALTGRPLAGLTEVALLMLAMGATMVLLVRRPTRSRRS